MEVSKGQGEVSKGREEVSKVAGEEVYTRGRKGYSRGGEVWGEVSQGWGEVSKGRGVCPRVERYISGVGQGIQCKIDHSGHLNVKYTHPTLPREIPLLLLWAVSTLLDHKSCTSTST